MYNYSKANCCKKCFRWVVYLSYNATFTLKHDRRRFISKFLKPLTQKKSEKDALVNVLNSYIKVPYTFNVRGFEIKIQKISATQKKRIIFV
jgi:hypothetical protein